MAASKAGGGSVYPCLRYRDAGAAIDWLCRVIGFERHMEVPDGGGGIAHAELVLGDALVMLGSDRDDQYGFHAPDAEGRGATLTCFRIDDIDALYARITGAGLHPLEGGIKDTDYGSRCFTLRDPEGHLWHFGTYDPWQATAS